MWGEAHVLAPKWFRCCRLRRCYYPPHLNPLPSGRGGLSRSIGIKVTHYPLPQHQSIRENPTHSESWIKLSTYLSAPSVAIEAGDVATALSASTNAPSIDSYPAATPRRR